MSPAAKRDQPSGELSMLNWRSSPPHRAADQGRPGWVGCLIGISRLPGYPHGIDATDAAVPLDRRRFIQLELRDAGRERRQALLEFDKRQRFADATMDAGTEGGR